MATALFEQTKSQFITHFNPRNLMNSLAPQDYDAFLRNSYLCMFASVPGAGAAVAVSYFGHYCSSKVEEYPILLWISRVVFKALAFSAGVATNFYLIRTFIAAPVAMNCDKAMRVQCLVVLGGMFVNLAVSFLPKTQLHALAPIVTLLYPAMIGGVAGCFPASALYVCGGIGAMHGSIVL